MLEPRKSRHKYRLGYRPRGGYCTYAIRAEGERNNIFYDGVFGFFRAFHCRFQRNPPRSWRICSLRPEPTADDVPAGTRLFQHRFAGRI